MRFTNEAKWDPILRASVGVVAIWLGFAALGGAAGVTIGDGCDSRWMSSRFVLKSPEVGSSRRTDKKRSAGENRHRDTIDVNDIGRMLGGVRGCMEWLDLERGRVYQLTVKCWCVSVGRCGGCGQHQSGPTPVGRLTPPET